MSKQSTARWISITGVLALMAYLAILALYTGGGAPSPEPTASSAPIRVSGTLSVVVQSAGGNVEIELPGATVSLRDPITGTDVATATTRLNGKFILDAPSTGSYSICWIVKDDSGCGPNVDVSAGLAPIPVRISSQTPVLHGTVLTTDGRACWVHDSFFELDVETVLDVETGGSPVLTRVLANTAGQYAILGLSPGDYVVYAKCEGAQTQTPVTLSSSSVKADLTLPNRAPKIWAMAAFDSGVGVTRVATSATVEVRATVRDPDLDPIEVLWKTVDGYGTIPGTTATKQSWTLPSVPGQYTLYAMARDGKGGYDFERFDLQVGNPDVSFSGRVIDETTQSPVAGASVEVNGSAVTTNAQGWFNVTVPSVTSDRYVLNARHSQYAVLSRIHDRSASGNTYPLTRAQTSVIDPTQSINLTDTQSAGPCGSPGGENPPDVTVLVSPKSPSETGETTQGEGSQNEPCQHRGARILIPPLALVDAGGIPATGPVTASTATLNPARRSLPGDYQAFESNGTRAELLSFGAVYAEFRDSSGNLLNLKPGTTAEVRIPVSNLQLPVAAPQIALWSYDEDTGFWVEEGIANLVNTAEGWMYIGPTRHFSTINMDVAGSDPAFATCVRLELDASLSAWSDLVLRAYVSYNGTSVQVKETALDGSDYHAIYRIPYGSSFPPNTLRLELRGTYSGQQVVLLDNIINTDARPKMTGTNLWPPYPYTECGDPITLTADPITLPYYGDIDATGRPAFLTGPYGIFLPEDGDAAATAYYAAIDPTSDKTTLGAWWDQNGFSATDGSGGTRAPYLNFNDLGFGRDMNCLVSGSDLACWVTNYGLPDQDLGNADAAETKDATKRGATVTMEYDASAISAERVQFYVYGGGDAGAPRIKFADLDGLGPKPIPHLCTVCHGGDFNVTTDKVDHARFREFDLPSFKYSSGRSWDFGSTSLSAAELDAFAALNEMVHDIAPSPSPIRSLIANWYTGGFSGAPSLPAVPSGWSSEVSGYHDVYATSCRTCHLARDEDTGSPFPFLTFDTSTNFSFTDYIVCGSPKQMPNAFVTYKNFWNDSSRVLQYMTLTGAATCE